MYLNAEVTTDVTRTAANTRTHTFAEKGSQIFSQFVGITLGFEIKNLRHTMSQYRDMDMYLVFKVSIHREQNPMSVSFVYNALIMPP